MLNATELRASLEAIIYAADEPVSLEQLASAIAEDKLPVKAALDELVASYAAEDRGIEIRAVAGGYKMYTKPQHHEVVRRFIKSLRPPLRLSMPALETLAVIAYKQPVTAPEISDIRGVNTSGVISTLLDKKLITTAGRKEVIGRPILYKTSKEFLMRFGLSDLDELPSLKEFEALAREALGTEEGVAPNVSEESVAQGELARRSPGEGGSSSPAVFPESSDRQAAPPSDNLSQGGNPAAPSGATDTSDAATGDESLSSDPISETIAHVQEELAAAEEAREHEALATSEGMPSGELDEDPPSAKSTSAD